MCGRMTLGRRDLDEVADELAAMLDVDAGAAAAFRPRYNVAPTDRHPFVRARGAEGGARRVLELGRWGFVGQGTASRAAPLINARADTAPFKPTFREAYVYRRCEVP